MSDPREGSGPRAPLSVATDLTLTIDGTEATIRSTGERLFVGFTSLYAALRALRGLPDPDGDRLAALLRTTDLTVEVRVRDRTVAVIGAEARPGVVSHRLGVDPVEVRLGGVLGVVGREIGVAGAALGRVLR